MVFIVPSAMSTSRPRVVCLRGTTPTVPIRVGSVPVRAGGILISDSIGGVPLAVTSSGIIGVPGLASASSGHTHPVIPHVIPHVTVGRTPSPMPTRHPSPMHARRSPSPMPSSYRCSICATAVTLDMLCRCGMACDRGEFWCKTHCPRCTPHGRTSHHSGGGGHGMPSHHSSGHGMPSHHSSGHGMPSHHSSDHGRTSHHSSGHGRTSHHSSGHGRTSHHSSDHGRTSHHSSGHTSHHSGGHTSHHSSGHTSHHSSGHTSHHSGGHTSHHTDVEGTTSHYISLPRTIIACFKCKHVITDANRCPCGRSTQLCASCCR